MIVITEPMWSPCEMQKLDYQTQATSDEYRPNRTSIASYVGVAAGCVSLVCLSTWSVIAFLKPTGYRYLDLAIVAFLGGFFAMLINALSLAWDLLRSRHNPDGPRAEMIGLRILLAGIPLLMVCMLSFG
jgi:hypothetical protein